MTKSGHEDQLSPPPNALHPVWEHAQSFKMDTDFSQDPATTVVALGASSCIEIRESVVNRRNSYQQMRQLMFHSSWAHT